MRSARTLVCAAAVVCTAASIAAAQGTQSTDESKALEKQLDAKVLGAWVLMSEDKDRFPAPEEMMKKVANCMKPVQVSQLTFGKSASRALPAPKNLYGDVVFFRETSGLHRFDIPKGNIILLSPPRTKTVDNKTLWAMVSQDGSEYGFVFADTFARGGKAQFMLENDNVYLRCNFDGKKNDGVSDGQ